MAYQSLYRRYRSRRFAEVLGQDHVVTALRNAARDGRVGHAYLFSGPRGTGKTSTARILAKVLNCTAPADGEPDLVCDSCLAVEAGRSFDLHELDAASNRGIDDIRAVIESTVLVSGGRTKVYILDEVHMLTPAASAALLKTLEEPPGHVVFVLATTDPQKVLPTIISRTQHFGFHLLPAKVLEAHVRAIIADAGLDVDEDGIEHVLRAGAGSARDTLSALDQVAAAGGVDDRSGPLDELVEALAARDTPQALAAVATATAAGRDPRVLAESLLVRLRDVFLAAMRAELDHLSDHDRERALADAERFERPFVTRALEVLGETLVDMRQAPDPRINLDVALVRLTNAQADTSLPALVERVARLERALATGGVTPPPSTGASSPPPPAPQPSRLEPPQGPAAGARRALQSRHRPPPPAAAAPSLPPRSAAPPPSERQTPSSRAALGAHHDPRSGPSPSPSPSPSTHDPLPSRDELTLAWADAVLALLSRPARARFSAGRFVGNHAGSARLALPNAVHRARCEELRPEVEAALAAHFGRPVPLTLVVEGDEPTPGQGGARRPDGTGSGGGGGQEDLAGGVEDEGGIDVSALTDAPADLRSDVERVMAAFPGAEVVEEGN